MKLTAILGGSGPKPMTDQDLQDWGGAIDERALANRKAGKTDPNVISAGEAVLSVINTRRGRS